MLLGHLLALFFLLPLVVHSTVVPASTSGENFVCSETCSEESSLVNFGVLRSHTYEFEIKHVISSPIDVNKSASFLISGNAVISGGVACTYELQLKDVKITEVGHDGVETEKAETAKLLEEKRAYFGYDNGKVTGFCPSKTESAFAWNIKAAILSQLQVQPKSETLPSEVIEEDISGKCITRYHLDDHDINGMTIVKRKASAGCGDKYNSLSRFNGVMDSAPSFASKSILVDGEQVCQVSVSGDKAIDGVTCEETIVINNPLPKIWSQVNQIDVTTTLKLLSADTSGSLEIDRPEDYLHSSLTYRESFLKSKYKPKPLEEIIKFLKEKGSMNADYFRDLVINMQSFSDEDFKGLMKYEESDFIETLFNAAIHSRTEASWNFIEWYLNDKNKTKIPYAQMSMVSKPTLKYIEAAQKALIKVDSRSYKIVVSNLLRSYCEYNPHCANEDAVIEIMKTFEIPIATGCEYSTEEEKKNILDSLRAIKNIGRVSNESIVYPALRSCLSLQSERDIDILVSTAEVFRELPPDNQNEEKLLNLINDKNYDQEVRIQAFRSYVHPLTKEKFFSLQQILSSSDQLSSYAKSYFNDIRESQDPSKQDEALLLRDVYQPLWRRDFRTSFYIEQFRTIKGYGGGVESSVIYGDKGFLPRSMDVNFTLNLLGNSINLLELNFRSKDEAFYNGSKLSVRMFNRDVNIIDNFAVSYDASHLLGTSMNFIGNNETFTLPTIGGLLIQVDDLVSISQYMPYYYAPGMFKVDINLDAVHTLQVGLNTNDGIQGFATEDFKQIKVPFGFTNVILKKDSAFVRSFEILSAEPNQTFFEFRRDVVTVSPDGKRELIEAERAPYFSTGSLSILKYLLGLESQITFSHYKSPGLYHGCKVHVASFEGLCLAFHNTLTTNRSGESSFSTVINVGRGRKSLFEDNPAPLLTFAVVNEFSKEKWSVEAKMDITKYKYILAVNSTKSNEFVGELDLNNWKANVIGTANYVGEKDFVLTGQAYSPKFNISVNYAHTGGERFNLTGETSNPVAPFYFDLSAEYAKPEEVKLGGQVKLLKTNQSAETFIHLRWDPKDAMLKHKLQFHTKNITTLADTEVIAMTHNREYDIREIPLAYNYSLTIGIKELPDNEIVTLDPVPTAEETAMTPSPEDFNNAPPSIQYPSREKSYILGTAGIYNLTDSDNPKLYMKSWFGSFAVDLNVTGYPVSIGRIDKTYEMQTRLSSYNVDIISAKGVVNMDGADVINGMFNGSLRHYELCKAGTSHLNVYFTNVKALKTLVGDITCGDTAIYKFDYLLDLVKTIASFNVTDAYGRKFRIHSPFTVEFVNGLITAKTKSDAFLNDEPFFTINNNFRFNSEEVMDELRVERVSDGAVIGMADLNALYGDHYNLKVNLPTIFEGFILDIALKTAIRRSLDVGAKFVLSMYGDQKHGFDFALATGPGTVLPLSLNTSVYGLVPKKSFIINFDAASGVLGYKQSSLYVKTHRDDEVILKLSGGTDVKTNEGEFAAYLSIHPGAPTPAFSGFLYKTQVSWMFTPSLIKVEQQGEWNGNKATPPGMPFRYGIQLATKSPTEQEFQVFAEDTHMGKVFGNEMIEVLYRHEAKNKNNLESNLLLNWRRSLGRGVVGSQATLIFQMDEAGKEGSAEFSWTLPDANQTEVQGNVQYKMKDQVMKLTSEASLGAKRIHQGSLTTKLKGSTLSVNLNANIFDILLGFKSTSGLDFSRGVDVDAYIKQKETALASFEVTVSPHKEPKVKIHLSPNGEVTSLDMKLKSKTPIVNLTLTNFDFEGYFKTQPVIFDSKFEFKVKGGKVKSKTTIQTASGAKHKQESEFKIAPDGTSFAVDIKLDSPLLTKGPLKISTKQSCASNHDLICNDDGKYIMSMKNKKSDQTFQNMTVIMDKNHTEWTSIAMETDSGTALHLAVNENGLFFSLMQADKAIINMKLAGSSQPVDGILTNIYCTLSNDENTIETGVVLSNAKFVNANLSTSGRLGKHDFALKFDLAFLLDLVTGGNTSSLPTKSYLISYDDRAFGVEFDFPTKLMITYADSPSVLRFAYDTSELGTFKGLLQASEPFQIDARTYINDTGEHYLAMSTNADVLGTVHETNLDSIFSRHYKKFLFSGCSLHPEACTSIILGSTATLSKNHEVIFTILIPVYSTFKSFQVRTGFNGYAVNSFSIGMDNENVGFGVGATQDGFRINGAWNRRQGGELEMIFKDNLFRLANSDLQITFERKRSFIDGEVISITCSDPDMSRSVELLEVKIHPGRDKQIEIRSALLKTPLIFAQTSTKNSYGFKLYQESVEAQKTPLLEYSSELTSIFESTYLLNLNNFLKMRAISNKVQFKQVFNSTLEIAGKNISLYMEREPGKRLYVNYNGDIVYEQYREYHYLGRNGYSGLVNKAGTKLAEAEYRTAYTPMQVFAAVRTSEKDAVFEGNMTSLLNMYGKLMHKDNILDASISTFFDLKRNIYYAFIYWRRGLLYDYLTNGLNDIVRGVLPEVATEICDGISANTLAEELGTLSEIIDVDMVKCAALTTRQILIRFFTSFGIPSIRRQNISQNELAELLYDRGIDWIDQLQKGLEKLDVRRYLYNEDHKSVLQAAESRANSAIFKMRKQLTDLVNDLSFILSYVESEIIKTVSMVKLAAKETTDAFIDGFDQSLESIEELQPLRAELSALFNSILEARSSIQLYRRIEESAFMQSLLGTIDGPNIDNMAVNQINLKLLGMAVDVIIHIPYWMRMSLAPLIVGGTGLPLTDDPREYIWTQINPPFRQNPFALKKPSRFPPPKYSILGRPPF